MPSPDPPAPSPDDHCCVCGGPLIEKKLKRFCERCGQLCETCCDGGRAE